MSLYVLDWGDVRRIHRLIGRAGEETPQVGEGSSEPAMYSAYCSFRSRTSAFDKDSSGATAGRPRRPLEPPWTGGEGMTQEDSPPPSREEEEEEEGEGEEPTNHEEEEEEEGPAPWTSRSILTATPFIAIALLFLLDRCLSGG